MSQGRAVRAAILTTALAALTVSLHAQTQTPSPDPAASLPNNWYGAFVSYDSSAKPGVAAGGTEASLISASAQMYSYSTWDVTLIKQPKGSAQAYTYQSTPRTGVAMIIRQIGPLYFIGFWNMGVATAGKNASLAMSGGGVALYKIGKTNWDLFAGAHVLDTGALGGSKTVPELGLGRMF